MFSLSAFADMVSEAKALAVANKFMNAPVVNSAGHRVARAPRKFSQMRHQVVNNQQFYVFNSTDESGFVIVSADDVARPILGYSDEGSLADIADNENLKSWLNSYNQEIIWAQENGITQSNEIQALWAQISQNTSANVVVAPLLQTNWNQGCYYNQYCPSNILSYLTGACGHVYAGCVACAMAQTMKFWNYPSRGQGSHTNSVNPSYGNLYADFSNSNYAWSSMPNELTSSSSDSQVNAVAKLIYHCGVALDMDYSYNGSSVATANVPNALVRYFKYSPFTNFVSRESNTFASWLYILTRQLSFGHPLVFAGHPQDLSTGHSFVCDGYKDDYSFHFNFGWSGSGNGYYYLDALTPPSGGL